MGLTPAQIQATYRARHPDRIAAYQSSDRCKEVVREAMRRWRQRNPHVPKPPKPKVELSLEEIRHRRREASRRHNAKRKGHILCTDFPPLPADMTCQLCGTPDKHLNMDHDHDTGRFRGYLCRNCNMGLGKLGDNVAGLERALAYLKGER